MEEIDPSINATTWQVVIKDSAGSSREGSASYQDVGGRLDFTWELAGSDTVASIHVGTQAQWQQRQPWALASRAQILQRVAAEAIRQKAPASQAHIDDQAGWIHLRAAAPSAGVPPAAPVPAVATAPHTAMRARKAKLSVWFAPVLVIAASAAIGMKGLFSIQSPTGTPLGPSIRTPQHVATIISTLEPYVPTLNRNPDEDRHTLSLFLLPLDGRSKEQVIAIAKGWRSRDLHQIGRAHV